ncbi:3-deoxy-D-manno-octulosonic acid kinase [Pusillimonas sp. MFBS29]|uniref:3-deoxy-D-manno-octulosonic acid kinase n=1 Tax=Pusillimonas sp. MFBS29 TaxID=2886690 RepID=UPI001D0F58DB|nr:3-deoxy-D-manno-octulosonic acid kinase [Pusillimonas sp. MFBS29]MCC2596404.1 3-deoxy-D-manno-octulosonic acid kinase [Pusillimonas sp. MFBS29]
MTAQAIEQQELPLGRDGAMLVDASRVLQPGAFLFDPTSAGLKAVPVGKGGRQAAWFVQGNFGLGVLRHYRRGGLIARLSANRYVWTGSAATRSFAEFNLLRYMYESGLPVPRPLAAAYWRQGPTYRAAILVQRIQGVEPLAVIWASASPGVVARAIYAMHEAGVWHADLNAYNILLDTQGKAWLIDFDKGRRQVLEGRQRQDNLLRLRRSLLKVAGDRAMHWWTEMDRAYGQLATAGGHI